MSNGNLGKLIQISNSKIGIKLSKKLDPLYQMDYENLFSSCHGMLNSLSRKTNSNVDRVELLSSIYSLGKISGGDFTFNYLNTKINPDKSKISEMDVMFTNLQTIFPDLQERFSQEDFIEFAQLYSDNPITNEVKVVRTIYLLKMLMQYYKNNGNYNHVAITDFAYDRIEEIANQYKENGQICLTPKVKEMIDRISYINFEFNDIEKDYLNGIIHNYNEDKMTKRDFIMGLNDFKIELEKKTKVR